MNYTLTSKPNGAWYLYFRWQNIRHRKAIAWNCDEQAARTAALAYLAHVTNNAYGQLPPEKMRLKDVVPVYKQSFQAQGRLHWGRVEQALDLHILPMFGERLLADLTPTDGLTYLTTRREDGAKAGTLRR